MGLITWFLNTDQKKKKVSRISKILGKASRSRDPVSAVMSEDYDEWDRALEELFTLCETEDLTRALLKEYGVTRAALEKLYRTIIEIGGGQWRGKNYVPVSALANSQTLRYVLQTTMNDENDQDILREMVYNLVMYFQGDKSSMMFTKTKETDLLG